MPQKTGNTVYDANVSVAEGVRQVAVTAAANQTAVKTASVTYYQAVRASGLANNLPNVVSECNVALWELGQSGL